MVLSSGGVASSGGAHNGLNGHGGHNGLHRTASAAQRVADHSYHADTAQPGHHHHAHLEAEHIDGATNQTFEAERDWDGYYDLCIGYTDDRRHVMCLSTHEKTLRQRDEVTLFDGHTPVHLMTHTELIAHIKSRKKITITTVRYPPGHPRQHFRMQIKTSLVNPRRMHVSSRTGPPAPAPAPAPDIEAPPRSRPAWAAQPAVTAARPMTATRDDASAAWDAVSAENDALRLKIETVQQQIAKAKAINSRPASVSAASAQELTQQLAHLAMQNQKLRLQIAHDGTEPAPNAGQSRRIGNLKKKAAALEAKNAALEQVLDDEDPNSGARPALQAELTSLQQDGDRLKQIVDETEGAAISPEQLKVLRAKAGKASSENKSLKARAKAARRPHDPVDVLKERLLAAEIAADALQGYPDPRVVTVVRADGKFGLVLFGDDNGGAYVYAQNSNDSGLAIGDKVLKIDGEDVSRAPLDTINVMLANHPEGSVVLEVQLQLDKAVNLALACPDAGHAVVRKQKFSNVLKNEVGLGIELHASKGTFKNRRFFVGAITAGSVVAKDGTIRVGDTLLEINGVTPGKQGAEAFLNEVQKSRDAHFVVTEYNPRAWRDTIDPTIADRLKQTSIKNLIPAYEERHRATYTVPRGSRGEFDFKLVQRENPEPAADPGGLDGAKPAASIQGVEVQHAGAVAKRAGLVDTDEILTVNGTHVKVAQLRLSDVNLLLDSSGSQVKIGILRRPHVARIPPRAAQLGLSLRGVGLMGREPTSNKHMYACFVVQSVDPGSVASLNGVSVGDRLLTCNANDCRHTTLETVTAHLGATSAQMRLLLLRDPAGLDHATAPGFGHARKSPTPRVGAGAAGKGTKVGFHPSVMGPASGLGRAVAGKSALKDAVSVKESIRTCTITKLAGGAMGLGIQGSTNAKQSDQVSVHVSQVGKGGPAELGGVRVGDRILTVNGTSAKGMTYQQVLPLLKLGDTIKLKVFYDAAWARAMLSRS